MGRWTEDDLKKLNTNLIKNKPVKKKEQVINKPTVKQKAHRLSRPFGGWTIHIKGEVPSSKNSRITTYKKDATGKPFFDSKGNLKIINISSKATQNYIRETKSQYELYAPNFRDAMKDKPKPYHIYYKILRYRNDAYDYQNIIQVIADCMTKNEWIEDDDKKNVLFHPIAETLVNQKDEAGVLLIF